MYPKYLENPRIIGIKAMFCSDWLSEKGKQPQKGCLRQADSNPSHAVNYHAREKLIHRGFQDFEHRHRTWLYHQCLKFKPKFLPCIVLVQCNHLFDEGTYLFLCKLHLIGWQIEMKATNLTQFKVCKQILTFSQIKRVQQIDSNYHNPFHTFQNIKEKSIKLNYVDN